MYRIFKVYAKQLCIYEIQTAALYFRMSKNTVRILYIRMRSLLTAHQYIRCIYDIRIRSWLAAYEYSQRIYTLVNANVCLYVCIAGCAYVPVMTYANGCVHECARACVRQ
jgi:hypothetical protein